MNELVLAAPIIRFSLPDQQPLCYDRCMSNIEVDDQTAREIRDAARARVQAR